MTPEQRERLEEAAKPMFTWGIENWKVAVLYSDLRALLDSERELQARIKELESP